MFGIIKGKRIIRKGFDMKILELFCGTKSFSNIAETRGHKVMTVDNNPVFNPVLLCDINTFKFNGEKFDIVWASPPCECFSVATLGRNWNKDDTPKNDKTRSALKLLCRTVDIIKEINPEFYFIENPRCKTRKMQVMQQFHRKTVTYCQYGDTRMKPTDIWTNAVDWKPKDPCKNGDKCHVAAPRGSRTGTQGLKDAKERGRIPGKLCLEIIEYCERTQKGI